jgi:hypothetical protein
MSPEELKLAAIELFGERGFVSALAAKLKIERTQVWRYLRSNAPVPIPGPVEAAVECWLQVHRKAKIDETPTCAKAQTDP